MRTRGSAASSKASAFQYRDRAKERRLKYGEDDAPKANRLKERYLQAMEQVETNSNKASKEKSIDSSNIGNKMLQKNGLERRFGSGKEQSGANVYHWGEKILVGHTWRFFDALE